ncbi:MAG: glycosyltransferase [Deltaproteobacteria bacterium]|nr:glycosyltransferase [Deltaproteobacteria bacterium]
MKSIKIAYIITGLDTGGAEMMLYKLLSRIDRDRFEPVVFSLTEGGILADKIEALGITVYSIGMKRRAIPIIGLVRLIRLLRSLKPDIIQGWMYHANLVAQGSSIFLSGKIPVLWNIRGTHTDLSVEPLYTALTIWLGGRLSRFSSGIINNSMASAGSHEQKLGYRPEKRVIIPNGFDTGLFKPSHDARARLRAELGLPENAFLIGLAGRYHPMKDHENFLSAAASLLKSHPDVRFVLIGKDVEQSNSTLTERIKNLQLDKSVHLMGNRDDMPCLTAAFDIATSSSYGEGFSNALGEAMSCGVPCVATDVGDSRWIVGDTGLIVPPRDHDALAGAWQKMIEMGDENRRSLGLHARQRVIDNFSLDSVVKLYEELYRLVATQ